MSTVNEQAKKTSFQTINDLSQRIQKIESEIASITTRRGVPYARYQARFNRLQKELHNLKKHQSNLVSAPSQSPADLYNRLAQTLSQLENEGLPITSEKQGPFVKRLAQLLHEIRAGQLDLAKEQLASLRECVDPLALAVAQRLLAACEQQLPAVQEDGYADLSSHKRMELVSNLNSIEKNLAQVASLVWEADSLVGRQHVSLQKKVDRLQRQLEALEIEETTSKWFEELLTKVDHTEASYDFSAALSLLKEGATRLQLAQRQVNGVNSHIDRQLASWYVKVINRYNRLRQLHEAPLGAHGLEALMILIRDLTSVASKEKGVLVTYYRNPHTTLDSIMPVEEAVEIARERYINLLSDKVRESSAVVRRHLREFDPDEALHSLELWRTWPGIFDDMVLSEESRQHCLDPLNRMHAKVTQDHQKWVAANNHLQRAKLKLQQDPMAAYEHWLAAIAEYPHHKGLPALKTDLQKASWSALQLALQRAQEAGRREQWALVQSLVETAQQLLLLVGQNAQAVTILPPDRPRE